MILQVLLKQLKQLFCLNRYLALLSAAMRVTTTERAITTPPPNSTTPLGKSLFIRTVLTSLLRLRYSSAAGAISWILGASVVQALDAKHRIH